MLSIETIERAKEKAIDEMRVKNAVTDIAEMIKSEIDEDGKE
jgi:hypothetical protein